MTLSEIYSEFKALELSVDKVAYLESLKTFNLPYDINYDKLIEYWKFH